MNVIPVCLTSLIHNSQQLVKITILFFAVCTQQERNYYFDWWDLPTDTADPQASSEGYIVLHLNGTRHAGCMLVFRTSAYFEVVHNGILDWPHGCGF